MLVRNFKEEHNAAPKVARLIEVLDDGGAVGEQLGRGRSYAVSGDHGVDGVNGASGVHGGGGVHGVHGDGGVHNVHGVHGALGVTGAHGPSCVPRLPRSPRPQYTKEAEPTAAEWFPEQSMFAGPASAEQNSVSFDADMATADTRQAIEDSGETVALFKAAILPFYAGLKALFCIACSFDSGRALFGVSAAALLELFVKANLVNDEDLSFEVFAALLVEAFPQREPDSPNSDAPTLLQWPRFVLFLAQACVAKRRLASKDPSCTLALPEHLPVLLCSQQFACVPVQFRTECLLTLEVHLVLTRNRGLLQMLFHSFSDRPPFPNSPRLISFALFSGFLAKAVLLSNRLSPKHAIEVFCLCATDHFGSAFLDFRGFCQALCVTAYLCHSCVLEHLTEDSPKNVFRSRLSTATSKGRETGTMLEVLLLHLYNRFGSDTFKSQHRFCSLS